ncbi:sll0702 [Synechocystis sp. PCC 6803]|jgi:hypothetical protein|uniref:Sll0702 protein n=1 Tax=Synechocystis sp. (strain ATCC 27184 / PCC 6803 / Kazusa) TaxID=1111708 RepID=P72679_SYNY3|nr:MULTISPECIES: hypothetical protein [unclassified Synechocystis]BAM50382.1 hypothetical protein BEST7613_1451 [Synechocystis sp. PCC 6803] [Bacillus subtilis BEST7613]AGF50370.1 hypothetical protein MYO_11030 [Synechocystis sp. PCC 6803]ALJ66461.1 hypothetical protein AOY38_00525 [Synechocystis sp. PCC 6803]AVP88308.1 hypothetical protein C7I86_00535 [Synechocystis sp. IPPAS B-1465]MBD2619266.1 hypothetical protein [Synechocystis sp. FACHB-898]
MAIVINYRSPIAVLGACLCISAIAPVQAIPIQPPLLVSQTQLLPPPPASPNPVPDPSALSFTPNATSYRVMALITSPVEEQQVKAAYPGAFFTNFNGQRLLQIGSFSDPLNAQQAALSLQNLGLETVINP